MCPGSFPIIYSGDYENQESFATIHELADVTTVIVAAGKEICPAVIFLACVDVLKLFVRLCKIMFSQSFAE